MNSERRPVLFTALVAQSVAVGTTFGAFSLFVEPLETHFGVPRWQVSLGPTLIVSALAVGGIVISPSLDRGFIRRAMLIAAAGLAGVFLLASQAQELWQLALLAFAAGLLVPPLGPLGSSALVGRSFDEDRGRALGIVGLGVPIGGLSFAIIAGLLLQVGWRETLVVFAAIVALVVFPLVLRFIPAHVEAVSSDKKDERASSEEEGGLDFAALIRNRSFRFVALAFAIGTGVAAGWSSQLAPYLSGQGFSVGGTTAVVALAAGVAAIGTLGFGAAADKVSALSLYAGVLIGAGILVALLGLTDVSVLQVSSILAFGILMGAFIPLFTIVVSQTFGAETIGRAMSLANLLMLPVSAAAGPLTAAVHDSLGTYTPALLTYTAAYLLATHLLRKSR